MSTTPVADDTTHKSTFQPTRPYPTAPTENRRGKKSRGCFRILLILFLIALCLAAVAYGAYQYHQQQQAQLDSLRQELAKRIIEDERMNTLRFKQAQQDSILWQQTLKAKTIEAAHIYISAYPEGIFIDEAYLLLEELQRRQVSPVERSHITGAVENCLARIREQSIKDGRRTIKDIQYLLPDTLLISKRHVNRDSFIYIVHGDVTKVTIPQGKSKADTTKIDLQMTLDKHKDIKESNLSFPAKR